MSERRPTVTIAEVASAAGVSRATVSRVMNGRSTVDPEISRRVREAAAELQYRPSNVARSLSLGRTETVALVVPDLGNPLFQQILRGIMSAADPDGYRVLVADTAENPSAEAEIALEARLRCDALVLVSPRMPEQDLRELLPRAHPVVLVNRELTAPQPGSAATPTLSIDFAHGATAVVEHLVALGHRHLAYLAGPVGSASDAARLRGLRVARERHPDVRIDHLPCGSTVDAGFAAADTALATRATAVVAFNDLVAFGLLARLNETGVAVPGDVSIVGFDDIELARFSTPSLTTAAVPQADLGRRAWERLRAVINDPGVDPATLGPTQFEPRIEVRASTGPVPPPRGAATPSAPGPRWRSEGDASVLALGDLHLARYEPGDRIPAVHSPRPFLHPVHTLGGIALTDAGPVDHRHHYGASVAVADVNGTSHWGGRTFVRDEGPTLLDNHGRQVSGGARADGTTLHDEVLWSAASGDPQAREERTLRCELVAEAAGGTDAWVLDWRSALHAEHGDLVIASPATNGRPGAGYGGLFWRVAPAATTAVLSATGVGEELAHGSTSPWVAFVQDHETGPTTLLLLQHGAPHTVRPWFVRAAEYPGAGPALAWDEPLTVPAGSTLEIGLSAVLVDHALSLEEAAHLAARTADRLARGIEKSSTAESSSEETARA
nr:DUF6807 family protein [Oerskovia sp. JB1-3-2]